MDDSVCKLFLEFHQREDLELFRLLNDYFTTSKAVSELCESLRKCIERVEHNKCLLINQALRDFEEENFYYYGLLDPSFRKTVLDLRNFNEFYSNSDFDSGLVRKIQVCQKELTTMIVTLEKTMDEIDKKLKRVRGRRTIDYIRNLGKFVLGLVPRETLTTFVTSETTEALKREKTAMNSMKRATMVALKEVEKISRLVSRVKSVERSIRVTAEFAVKKRSSRAVAMGRMEEDRKRLKSTLFDLDKEIERCDGLVQFGRMVARDKIVEFLSGGERKASNSRQYILQYEVL